MAYTLGKAAEACGKSKSTLSKAIKSGRLSASKQPNGSYLIDPSELQRVFPRKQETVEIERTATPEEHPATRIAVLEAELLAERRRSEELQDQVQDLKQDRDDWKNQARALISDQRPPRKGFFASMFGGKESDR